MTEISKYVEELYNKLIGEESLPISEDSVKETHERHRKREIEAS